MLAGILAAVRTALHLVFSFCVAIIALPFRLLAGEQMVAPPPEGLEAELAAAAATTEAMADLEQGCAAIKQWAAAVLVGRSIDLSRCDTSETILAYIGALDRMDAYLIATSPDQLAGHLLGTAPIAGLPPVGTSAEVELWKTLHSHDSAILPVPARDVAIALTHRKTDPQEGSQHKPDPQRSCAEQPKLHGGKDGEKDEPASPRTTAASTGQKTSADDMDHCNIHGNPGPTL